MSNPRNVIEATDLSKRYRLGVTDHAQLVDGFKAFFKGGEGRGGLAPVAEGQRSGRDFWALRGVSFSVQEGEVVGVIGRNGAGKSTLLKLLSRITKPTTGRIRMRGRSASLLEVGTGFHPELTGAENIRLNGAIMGMRRSEITAKFDEIIAFSGIEHHIDTPIKRYSTGMKVRLGFAVAAHLDPEILVVDEVLAVGDAEFQRRCLGRMRSVADSGRTVLFVSHNMFSVQSMCSRVLWMEAGAVKRDGGTASVIGEYLAHSATQAHERVWAKEEAPGTPEVRLMAVRVQADGTDGAFRITQGLTVELVLENIGIQDTDLNIQVIVRTEEEFVAFVSDMTESIGVGLWTFGPNVVRCSIPADLLNDGVYRVSILFQRKAARHFLVEDALTFTMQEGPRRGAWFQKWQGAVRPKLQWLR